MNQVSLIGRLGADPKLRQTNSNKSVCDFNIAIDDGFGDNKKTYWFSCVCWEKTAETASKFLAKGSQVGICGRLTQEEFTPKDSDKPVTKTRIVVTSLTLIGSKPAGERPQTQGQAYVAKVLAEPDATPSDDTDEIPF